MSDSVTHLWVNEPGYEDDSIFLSCRIERIDQPTLWLWYRVPQQYATSLNPRADAFVVGSLFTAMRIGHPLHVHGTVSASLLRNLEEFQGAWRCWRPSQYQVVEVTADHESTDLLPRRDHAIFGFSGGVDSTFTLYRHTRQLAGRRSRRLGAGLLVHGFDIPLAQTATFQTVKERMQRVLNEHDIECIPLVTNFQDMGDDWEDAFGVGLASCLWLFAGGYGGGLIASGEPYHHLKLPWGSSPVTDHLLSADDMPMIHDGAEYARIDKIAVIGAWEEARRHLRVCWEGPRPDANCGVCEKCIRTMLCFRALDLGLPECFQEEVTDQQILALHGLSQGAVSKLAQIVTVARQRGVSASWMEALESVIHAHQKSYE